jgi:CRP/FNR family cyclic AMP-dependent transcriptional regulator
MGNARREGTDSDESRQAGSPRRGRVNATMAISLLDSLTADARAAVLERSSVRRLRAGEHLFHHGDEADSMYLVETGRLAVRTTTSDGQTAIVRVIGRGNAVGELALLVDGARRTGTVTALEPTVLRVILRARFSELRARDPQIDRALVVDLATRLAALSEQFVLTQYGTVEQRVLERLLVLDEVYRHGWIDVTQEELGAMSGASRQSINRVLVGAAGEGLIALRRGAIKVLDADALATRQG